jgi:hypothetical protein
MSRFVSLACIASIVIGCGGAQHGASTPVAEIDRIRSEAAAHPHDAAAQRRLAEWELLGDGGDVARAGAAIEAALALSPNDVGLTYLRAVLAEQHGDADAALEAFLGVVRLSLASDDALAPAYAESALAYVHDLRIDAPHFVDRARPVFESAFAAPGHAGLPVRRQLYLWLASLALERGDLAEEQRLAHTLGAPTEAHVAGPFGITVLAGFDTTLPAEARGPLADSYDLGPGRGTQPTRALHAEHGALALADEGPPETRGPGTRIVEATIHADQTGRYVLALGAPGSVQISLDGSVVARIDRRAEWHGATIYQALDLSAGDHELELKISSRVASPTLVWLLDRADGAYSPESGIALNTEPEGPLALFVSADVLSDRGETIAARELLRTHVGDTSSAALLSLAARVAAVDPFVPDTRRADDERRLVHLAVERDAEAMWARGQAASLETGDVESLAAQRAVAEHFSSVASVQLSLASTLMAAGYVADGDRAIDRAVALRPDACAVMAARFTAFAQRGRVDQLASLVDQAMACDARSTARYELLMGRRDWAGARTELTRLSPLLDENGRRTLALRIARASGDAAEEARLVAEEEAHGQPGAAVVHVVDRDYAAGHRADAVSAIDAEARRAPRHAGDLRSLAFALSGHDVMEPWRVDGLDVVRRFEASGRSYDGHAAVLVFDYEVTRVFPDGSALDLVHQIYRVQTAEGVERFGALDLTGRVLTVRAIGPGGVTREPDAIAASTDMPPLEIGDYVEYEYVREHQPSWGDAYSSEGWVFQNFTSPFDHSEMIFVAPVDMPLTFDVRGPVPPPTETVENGLRSSRFVMEQSQPLVAEPNWVADPPVLPSLRAVARVTWDRMYGSVYDGLLGLDVRDPAALRVLHEEVLENGQGLSPHEQAQRIHHWVMDNVEATDGAFYQSAPLMLAARRGSRLRVLRYLLELAGIPARIVYARELAGVRPLEGAPDANVYSSSLVVATMPDGPLYLAAIARGVPHDYLPPGLRHQDAIVIEPGLSHVTLPASQGSPSRQHFDGTVDIAEDGVAHVTLTLRFEGGAAAELRSGIEQVAPAERSRILAERFVPSVVPGGSADPSTVQIEGLDAWEGPLTIAFVADSHGMVRPARDGFHVVSLFPSGLEPGFARLATRTTTELVGEVDTTVALTIHGPGVLHAPEPAEISGPGGAYGTLRVGEAQGGGVTLARQVVLPIGLVPVATYPAFATFCRAITQLDQRTVVITPN